MVGKDERRCMLIRSEFSRSFVNFSYVVYSEVHTGNNIELEVTNYETGDIISHTLPDKNSFQGILKYESDGKTNYKACFIAPNDFPKSIRVYIEHVKREDFVSRDNIYGSLKLLEDLKEEETRLEEALFLDYMNLKNIDETLTKSQKVLTLAFVLKFLLFLAAAVLQFYGVAKLFSKMNVSFSEIV